MGLVLLLFAGVICWALFKPSQPRQKRRRPAPLTPDEDLWFIGPGKK
jgi:hypothetical protein